MAAMETKKRKRDVGPPRVTFNTPSRTFERLLKESSLGALRSAVSKKLGLDSKLSLELCQIRDGKNIDLEDEDDFDAFRSYAASNGVAEVKITILNSTATPGPGPQFGAGTRQESPLALNKKAPSKSNVRDKTSSITRNPVSKPPDRTSQVKPNKLAKRSGLEPPVSALSKDVEESGEAPQPDKSKDLCPKPATEKSTERTVGAASIPDALEASTSFSPHQEPAEVPKPDHSRKAGKDNEKEKEKRPRKKGAQASTTDIGPATLNVTTSPAAPSMQPSTVSRPEVEPETAEPAQGSNKAKPKTRKTAAGVETGNRPNQKEPDADLPTTPSPTEKPVPDEQQGEQQTTDSNARVSLPTRDEPKAKKRMRDQSDQVFETAAGTNKPKRRKINSRGEPESISPVLLDAVSTDAKAKAPKAEKKRRKEKVTPVEESQVQEAIDNAIAKVLAKRVSASSNQIASTEPVTTATSSAPVEEINAAGPGEQSLSKRRKRKKRKSGISSTKPSVELEPAPEQTRPNSEVVGNGASVPEKDRNSIEPVQAEPQEKQSDQAFFRPSDTVAVNSTVSHITDAVESRSVDESDPQTQTQSQPELDAGVSKTPTDPRATANRASSPPAKEGDPHVSQYAMQPTLSSTEHITERQRENSSSDSDSDLDSDTFDSLPKADQCSGNDMSSSHVPASAFVIPDLGTDEVADIDSLLKSTRHVSWWEVPENDDNGNEEKQELMSDAEEESAEEDYRRTKKGLSVRYAPSTASEGDNDEDVDDYIESGSVVLAKDSDPTSEIESFSEDAAREEEAHVGSQTERVVSGKDGPSQEAVAVATQGSSSSVVPDTSIPPGHDRQSQSSPPLPSFSDVNKRGESVLTEHVTEAVVNRAMEEDDTLYLMNLGMPQQRSDSRRPSVVGDIDFKAAPSGSLDEAVDKLGARGGKTSIENLRELENRDLSPELPPSSPPNKQHPPRETKDAEAASVPQSSQSLPASQSSVVSRMSLGMVKRMRGRSGKKVEAEDFPSQPEPLLSDFDSVELADAKELHHSEPSESSQSTDSGASRVVATQSPADKEPVPVADTNEVTSKSRPAAVPIDAVKRDRPRTRAETAARPSPQKRPSSLSQPTRASAPTLSRQGTVARHVSSQPPPTLKKDLADSGSTTEVERSEGGKRQPGRKASPGIHSKNAGVGSSLHSPAPSQSEEDSGLDDSDDDPLPDKVQSQTPRPSIVGLRSLRNLASQPELFSPASTPRLSFVPSPVTRFGSQTPAAINGIDSDSDDSSNSSSDSELEEQSHIPKGKRAGYAR